MSKYSRDEVIALLKKEREEARALIGLNPGQRLAVYELDYAIHLLEA